MIKVEDKEEIRRLYFWRRWSIRKIARELGHSRKTVRKALNDASPPVYKRRTSCPERVIGPVKHIIESILEEDKKRPIKQRHTARRIYQRLVDEHDFKGSESTVRKYVRRVRGDKREVCYHERSKSFGKDVLYETLLFQKALCMLLPF